MSELKATTVYDAYWKANSVGEGTGVLVYLKSEADKVIAHQKFKRCLAMANWCMTEYLHSKCIDFTNTEQWYWRRWHIRWRNLAKKFKEAK